jgi:superfamily I DNA/RNA helicase
MPYGFGVVLSNITRQQFDCTDLPLVLPEHQVICKDEMDEAVDPEVFQKRLWDMFNVRFGQHLTLPQVDRVRWHLFPEIRIAEQSDIFGKRNENEDVDADIPDIVKVMDLEQERLARSLGAGHRVIHGVAGSGKTMILGYRCLYLAKFLHKPILVLCYNITLATRLKSLMQQYNLTEKVDVYHFHDWCGEMLRRYHVAIPESSGKIFDRMVDGVIKAVEKQRIPGGQYGAVLVDEGHDFKPEWLRLVADMLDPDTNTLLLLYDDAQSIYRSKSDLGFSLSSVGIQARGRTTILKLNYRNTEEILRFAYQFVSHYIKPCESHQDIVPVVEPSTAGRRGPLPVVKLVRSFDEECSVIVGLFRKLHEQRGVAWADMCVTYSQRWMGKELARRFMDAEIPVAWLCNSKAKRQFRPEAERVKLMTMHSSKGLEFGTVAACGVGYMASSSERVEEDAKLLYVAMTRATHNLLITATQKTEFTEKLLAA